MLGTPRIHKAFAEQIVHAVNFRLGVARRLVVVGLGIGQVDFLVGDVEVAAVYDGLLLVVVSEQVRNVAVPGLTIGYSTQIALRIGHVGGSNVELREFSDDEAAFPVMFGQAHPHFHAQGGFFGNQRGAAVALLFSRMGVHMVACAKKHFSDLLFGCFCFLKTHDIRIPCGQLIQEAFTGRCPNSIHIPGNNFHAIKVPSPHRIAELGAMGVIHKCLLGAAAVSALSCQPRWVYSASYQFANNAQLVQYDALTIMKYKAKASLGQYGQILTINDQTAEMGHLAHFSLEDGHIEFYQLISSSSPSYSAIFQDGLMEVFEGFISSDATETHSLPAGPLYHPVMATQYPLVVDAIWRLQVGEEHLLSMVQPPKGNISVASYYLAQKTAKERIYLYRNDSNVGTLTYQKHRGRWVLQKVDLMNQDVPYVWERIEAN